MIAGRYFDGTSSAGSPASLTLDADGFARLHGLPSPVRVPLEELVFSERVGNITRRVALPGGGSFETQDNDGVDAALQAVGLTTRGAWVHALESRWRVVLASLAGIVLVSMAFLRWGVPALATQAARIMPVEVDRAIGSGSLDILDRLVFSESGLSEARRLELNARFIAMTAPLDDEHRYQLEFRGSPTIGANAFALPSGIVVVTDELVALAEHDDEIVAVLAHEIGHVRGRHALRQMLQAAGVSALAVALLGDVSSISGILSAAPALLHAKHSRDFEREADAFAKQWLGQNGIPLSRWDAIMCRMTEEHGGESEAPDFFSSHPATGERARCEKT
jgi:Zn-dependent protease with chaperone function